MYGNECATCNNSTIFFWWFVVIWALCGCTCAYYTTNPRVNAIASARQTGGISVGLAIKWLQTVAIIGMMTVTWPPSVAGHFTTLQVFLLDVDAFSFSCFVSEQASFRYIMKVSCFPLAILWMIGNFEIPAPTIAVAVDQDYQHNWQFDPGWFRSHDHSSIREHDVLRSSQRVLQFGEVLQCHLWRRRASNHDGDRRVPSCDLCDRLLGDCDLCHLCLTIVEFKDVARASSKFQFPDLSLSPG